MTESVAELLWTLHKVTENKTTTIFDSRTETELEDFEGLLVEITTWLAKQRSENFLKALYHTSDRVSALDRYHKRLVLTIDRFNVSNGLRPVRDCLLMPSIDCDHLIHLRPSITFRGSQDEGPRTAEHATNRDSKGSEEISQSTRSVPSSIAPPYC